MTLSQLETEIGKGRGGATTSVGEQFLRCLVIIEANRVVTKRHAHAAAIFLTTSHDGPCTCRSTDPGSRSKGEALASIMGSNGTFSA